MPISDQSGKDSPETIRAPYLVQGRGFCQEGGPYPTVKELRSVHLYGKRKHLVIVSGQGQGTCTHTCHIENHGKTSNYVWNDQVA